MDIEEFWKKIQSLPDWLYFAVVLLIALLILFAGTAVNSWIERL